MKLRLTGGMALALALLPAIAPARGEWQVNPDGSMEIWIQRIEESSRLLIQMRPIFEALHWTVEWAPRSRTIRATHDAGHYRMVMQIDNPVAVVNGAQSRLDVPPRLLFSTTYVPLRFVAEVTGCEVDYRGTEVRVTGRDWTALIVHLIGD